MHTTRAGATLLVLAVCVSAIFMQQEVNIKLCCCDGVTRRFSSVDGNMGG